MVSHKESANIRPADTCNYLFSVFCSDKQILLPSAGHHVEVFCLMTVTVTKTKFAQVQEVLSITVSYQAPVNGQLHFTCLLYKQQHCPPSPGL